MADKNWADGKARIGPNAVTQLLAALRAAGQASLLPELVAIAGGADWLAHPPTDMIEERAVARLHQAVRRSLPSEQAGRLMADAGRRTADYLLAARIPLLARIILACLPPALAARLLVRAIRANAWTFAGSARFDARAADTVTFELRGNPFCAGEVARAPVCAWHAAVLQRLFSRLVSRRMWLIESACEARGDACCRFIGGWRQSHIV